MAGVLARLSAGRLSASKRALVGAISAGSQNDVAPFALRTDQALLLQSNCQQTKT